MLYLIDLTIFIDALQKENQQNLKICNEFNNINEFINDQKKRSSVDVKINEICFLPSRFNKKIDENDGFVTTVNHNHQNYEGLLLDQINSYTQSVNYISAKIYKSLEHNKFKREHFLNCIIHRLRSMYPYIVQLNDDQKSFVVIDDMLLKTKIRTRLVSLLNFDRSYKNKKIPIENPFANTIYTHPSTAMYNNIKTNYDLTLNLHIFDELQALYKKKQLGKYQSDKFLILHTLYEPISINVYVSSHLLNIDEKFHSKTRVKIILPHITPFTPSLFIIYHNRLIHSRAQSQFITPFQTSYDT